MADEVRVALNEGRPVVALESTIISHGMPYPRNAEVARAVEEAVRRGGAVPATCAIIKGVPTVGLSDMDLELLARGGHAVAKASRRDLGAVMASGGNGATTVAATMILAHLAGISIFATGGIGGVHRGAETSMDISADLLELARTPVTVVCAGVKSILDIPKTLEVLETQGVPVLGYKCAQFPAFFTNDSGVASPVVVPSALEVAKIMAAQESLRLGNGIVVGVPNPSPADAAAVAVAIDAALALAEQEGIRGARITPYLLAAVERLTGGRSLDANVALVMHNAGVAAEIAGHHAVLRQQQAEAEAARGAATHKVTFATSSSPPSQSSSHDAINSISNQNSSSSSSSSSTSSSNSSSSSGGARQNPSVVVFGAAAVDVIASVRPAVAFIQGSSNPGHVRTGYGGVGR